MMGHGSSSEGGSLLERQPAASLTWVVAHQGSQVPQGYSGNASFKGRRSVSGQVQRKVTWVHHKAMICGQLQYVDLSLQEPVLTPSLGTPPPIYEIPSGKLPIRKWNDLSFVTMLLSLTHRPYAQIEPQMCWGLCWLLVIWPNTLPALFLPIPPPVCIAVFGNRHCMVLWAGILMASTL